MGDWSPVQEHPFGTWEEHEDYVRFDFLIESTVDDYSGGNNFCFDLTVRDPSKLRDFSSLLSELASSLRLGERDGGPHPFGDSTIHHGEWVQVRLYGRNDGGSMGKDVDTTTGYGFMLCINDPDILEDLAEEFLTAAHVLEEQDSDGELVTR